MDGRCPDSLYGRSYSRKHQGKTRQPGARRCAEGPSSPPGELRILDGSVSLQSRRSRVLSDQECSERSFSEPHSTARACVSDEQMASHCRDQSIRLRMERHSSSGFTATRDCQLDSSQNWTKGASAAGHVRVPCITAYHMAPLTS